MPRNQRSSSESSLTRQNSLRGDTPTTPPPISASSSTDFPVSFIDFTPNPSTPSTPRFAQEDAVPPIFLRPTPLKCEITRTRSLPDETSMQQITCHLSRPKFNPSIVGNKEIREDKTFIRHELVVSLIAEVLGTAILIFFGTGSILSNQGELFPSAITWGFAVFALVIVFGSVSGAHFNPAVTIAFFLLDFTSHPKGQILRLSTYLIAQLAGATLGAVMVHDGFPNGGDVFFGTRLSAETSIGKGFFLEAVTTFIFIFTIVTIHHNIKKIADKEAVASNDVITSPFAVAFVVAAVVLVTGPYTGASINPARSFGPALVMGLWSNHWLYWAAPITGSVIAVIFYKAMHLTKEQRRKLFSIYHSDPNKPTYHGKKRHAVRSREGSFRGGASSP